MPAAGTTSRPLALSAKKVMEVLVIEMQLPGRGSAALHDQVSLESQPVSVVRLQGAAGEVAAGGSGICVAHKGGTQSCLHRLA